MIFEPIIEVEKNEKNEESPEIVYDEVKEFSNFFKDYNIGSIAKNWNQQVNMTLKLQERLS